MHPPELKRQAIALYDSGLSARAVTKRMKAEWGKYIAPQTVARWTREVGKNRSVGEPRTINLDSGARRLYGSGLTIEKVANRYRVGKTTAGKRLREMGTVIRPSGSRFLHLLTKERLRALYVQHRWTMKTIADQTGCSPGTVYRLLQLHSLRRDK